MMVKILYRHPNPLVMAKEARILDDTPKGGDTEYYEPVNEKIEFDGKKVDCITYTVHERFARKLLASQPERYFLLTPDTLFVKTYTPDKLGSVTTKMKSILLTGFDDVKKEEAPEAPAEKKEPVSDNTFGNKIHTSQDAVEAKHAADNAELTKIISDQDPPAGDPPMPGHQGEGNESGFAPQGSSVPSVNPLDRPEL